MADPSLSRRSFVESLAAALAATMLPPSGDARAEDGEVFGQGEFRYRHVPGWGVLDAGTPVKDCHGMVQGHDGRIFLLTNHTANNIVIYDKAGKLLGKWGTDWPGAHGLTLFVEDGEERFFITDHDRHQAYKTTLDGKVLMTLDWPESTGKYPKAEQYKPTHVAVAPDGSFYVSDGYGLNHVIHYDRAGKIIGSFGGREGAGALKCAHGIHVDLRDPGTPSLLITSRSEHCIKRFTMAGEFIDAIRLPGAMPCFMIPNGEHIIVPHLKGAAKPQGSDTQNGFVSVLDRENRIVSNIGAAAPVPGPDRMPEPMSASGTLFRYPHGLMVDDEGSIYVAQWNSNATYPIKLQRV